MPRIQRLLIAACLALLVCPGAFAGKTRNVILVITDGVRWQEVFTGADPTLLNDKEGGSWTPVAELKQKYWDDDPTVRRKLLFPFLWGTVATHGQLFGNQDAGSVAHVTNAMWFSYPGYNEMASGVDDPRIDSNEFGPNPNVTVFEWLNTIPEFAGKVEIFGTWSAFADIFNVTRSKLPIRAGATLVDASDLSPRGRLMTELYQTTTRLEGTDPFDSFLHVALRDHLKTHRPRVLFVGYGDTDTWGHVGRYDALLETVHSFDGFVADLWKQLQSIPAYKDKTTLIISTDHGRGSGPVEWKDHGVEEKGSENIWIAVMGPDTPPLGERHNVAPVTQSQIAATIAAVVGQDFRAFKPAAAPSLLEALSGR
ncbi:MAG TPA: alkaline phosphatase family protein [Steroidobacteraceae bacterium]|nr:alkaline phosphatase family protein [Steroidobacteraceae bacterium]